MFTEITLLLCSHCKNIDNFKFSHYEWIVIYNKQRHVYAAMNIDTSQLVVSWLPKNTLCTEITILFCPHCKNIDSLKFSHYEGIVTYNKPRHVYEAMNIDTSQLVIFCLPKNTLFTEITLLFCQF